ncbi:hypothetical protein GN278_12545 [Rhodobacteraceae bacterium Araon29]
MAWPAPQTRINTRTVILCLTVIAALGFAVGWLTTNRTTLAPQHISSLGISVDTEKLKQVVLQSHLGRDTTWGSFSGSPKVVFFGYTFCPDICPMGLSNVTDAVDILEQQGLKLNPIFITVDPKRDTPDVLKDYVTSFDGRIVGLTGKEDMIKALASAFMAFYEVNTDTKDDEYYLIDHTSFIYLVGSNGEVLGYYPETKSPQDLANAILADFR